MTKDQTLFRHLRYIKPYGKKRNQELLANDKFYAMVSSVFTSEWLCVKWIAINALKTKTLKFPVDQIGTLNNEQWNTNNELFQHKMSHTQYLRRASRHCHEKRRRLYFGDIFINYGEKIWQYWFEWKVLTNLHKRKD